MNLLGVAPSSPAMNASIWARAACVRAMASRAACDMRPIVARVRFFGFFFMAD